MKKILFSLFLVVIACTVFAQSNFYYLSGKIINKNTMAPMPAASVFALNTTFGTVTDTGGNFTIKLPNGGYDLGVTYTGFETYSIRISTANATDKNFTIQLKPKEKEMEEVAVVSSGMVPKGWEKYGQFFTDNFIGTSKYAHDCTIQNHEALQFYFSKKRNRLKVKATEPIVIINNALGYTLKYALDSFTNDYNTQYSVYAGSPLYEEMVPINDAQKTKWQDNRLHVYNGSVLHFMKSFYAKTLKENGFEVQYLVKNNGVDSALQLKDFYTALNYDKEDSTQTVAFTPNQPDVIILYNKEKPSADYLAQSNDTHTDYQVSVISITPQKSIIIEQNGYYYDQNDITTTGYWTWRKSGDALPYDYNPQ